MSRLVNPTPLLRKLCLAMVALIALVSSVQASEGGGTAEATPSLDGQAPAVYGGTPVGFTDEGYAYRGDPKAPVTIQEYSDYLCPFCARHALHTLPTLIHQYVRTGKLRYVFSDFPVTELHPEAAKGAAAARCLGEQSPVLYWKMHDELFRRQSEWNRLADPAGFLAGLAAELGADTAEYQACISSGRALAKVRDSVDRAKGLGFTGTPSFQFTRGADKKAHKLVGAQPAQVFTQWVDAMLATGAPPEPEKTRLPYWATPEGLTPDPARPGFTRAGDAYKGDPKAPLVVVEFADFQCPFCKRHALETQPTLDREFVDTGKVMWVLKNLPLSVHHNALAAGAAAECAGEQGKFWEMYHLLFETQGDWSGQDPDQALPPLADRIGLDRAAFDRCFNSRKAVERVVADYYDAQQGGIGNTPTFLFIAGGVGVRFQGAKTLALFKATVETRYERAVEQAAKSEEQAAKSEEQAAKSEEQTTKSEEQTTKPEEQHAKSEEETSKAGVQTGD